MLPSDVVTARQAIIVVLQHGEKVSSPGDPGLTALGRRQASYAAARLAALSPVALVSSPLARARETAEPVATRCGLSVAVDKRLAERMNLGPEDDPGQFFAAWLRTSEERDWTPQKGRSSHTTGTDMLAALDDCSVTGRIVVLASHGGSTTDLLRTLLGDDELERRASGLIRNGVPGGAVTTLRRTGTIWSVDAIADLQHIPEEDRTGHVR